MKPSEIADLLPSAFISHRLADMGGWEKLNQRVPGCIERTCLKCGAAVVLSPKAAEFLEIHPQPLLCTHCARPYLEGVPLMTRQDEATGVVQVTRGYMKWPEGGEGGGNA